MTTGYKIKDIADRSGFTPATLRFYEEIGLLPQSSRTAAGYRVYDDATLYRLAFISRAKQLGCSLDEISDLTIAWEGGRCGPVQDRLREVVADKLVSAQQQIVELMTLSAELQRAATTLELHRPDGPCDERCGCVAGDGSEMEDPRPVTLISKGDASDVIACGLGSESMKGRLDEWHAVLAHVIGREVIDGGVRATFDAATPFDELMRLTIAEQECCRFFWFSITVDGRGVALEIRSTPDALPIVHSLFGVAA